MKINTVGTVRDARGIANEENIFNVVSTKNESSQKQMEEVKEELIRNESLESEEVINEEKDHEYN